MYFVSLGEVFDLVEGPDFVALVGGIGDPVSEKKNFQFRQDNRIFWIKVKELKNILDRITGFTGLVLKPKQRIRYLDICR
jgi:hypothetical protein